MYEVEAKVPVDAGRLRERLDAVGARPLGTVVQTDTYYDAPDRDFESTDEALRVRCEREDDDVRVTYKGPLVDDESKTRTEIETAVDDEEAMTAIFEALGYEAVATVRKERERYRLDDCTVTLDAVEGLDEYLEVETDATEESLEDARRKVYAVLEKLGIDPSAQVRTSYLGMLLEESETDPDG